MSDELMLHGVLNMPLPDNPAECDIVTWVQFRERAMEASARIEELEAQLAKSLESTADLYRLHLRRGPAWDHPPTKQVMEDANTLLTELYADLKGQDDGH